MKYECCPNDPEHFATALRRDNHTHNLIWDNARGQDVIIVQTPFGSDASSILPEICNALNNNEKPLTDYVEIMNGVWVCYVTAADKARNNGCRLNGEASTYTVFSCLINDDICKVFQPKNQAMISQSYSIPLELHVSVKKEMRTEGLFRHREVETGFYSISFPTEMSASYFNGSICYRVNDFEAPITREMIEQGQVFIKTLNRPEIIPMNKGIKIV